MRCVALRLEPGDDIRRTLQERLASSGCQAGYVLQGVGSLAGARLRWAGIAEPTELAGDFEILTLAGSLSVDGAHLHMSISNSTGQVLGGHVAFGCTVRTTAEIVIGLLPAYRFNREIDPATGFEELTVTELAQELGAQAPATRK
jgi:predicted DNA-binding protein with PD1-like motif